MKNFAVVIDKEYETRGLGRYAFGFGVAPNVRIYYAEKDAVLSELVSEENIILAGYLDIPQDIADRNIYMMVCSPLGQMYLSGGELEVLYRFLVLRAQGKIKNIIATSAELAGIYGMIYVPAVRRNFKPVVSEERSGYSFIGNNQRLHKNVANTMAAIALLSGKNKQTVYVNNPDLYIPYQMLFGLEFEPFVVPDGEYNERISKHKLLFQVDYSASFNYLALEYAMCGVPIICSKSMFWCPKELIVENTDSPVSILQTATFALENYKELSEALPKYAMDFNVGNMNKVTEVFGSDEIW